MTCELITGSSGTEHISSADDGSMFASVFGDGRFAVKQGNDLAATMGSANSITIATGAGFMDGRYWRVTSAETLTIDSGAQGVNRIDLVGVKYQYNNGTGVESCVLAVVKGTAVAGTPSTPSYTDGNILNGATEAFFPLYSITLTGITPGTPVKLFKMMTHTVMCPWPVGAVLQMTNANDPNNEYPGTTWNKIEGKFLLGSSSSYALGTTGGAASVTLTSANLPAHTHTYDKAGANTDSHTLTIQEMPAHNHDTYYLAQGQNGTGGWFLGASNNKTGTSSTSTVNKGGGQGHTHGITASSTASGSTGSGTAVNKMPPYKVVNTWERVA